MQAPNKEMTFSILCEAYCARLGCEVGGTGVSKANEVGSKSEKCKKKSVICLKFNNEGVHQSNNHNTSWGLFKSHI